MNKSQLCEIMKAGNPGIKLSSDCIQPGYMFTSRALGLWDCVSISGQAYVCDTINKTCTCKSFYYKNQRPCKHLRILGCKS